MSRQDDLRQLISNHQRRLQKSKEQAAKFGPLHTPPYISIEIEDTEAELNRLSDELAGLRGATPPHEETPRVSASTGPQVFISYSRRDIEFVQKLAADLERAGLRTWWDVSKLAGGDILVQTIEAALEASAYCLVVLSPDAREAKWVRKEYMYALDLGLKVIPLLCKECKIPLALHDLQYVDGRADRYESGLRQLLSIFALEAKPAPPPPVGATGRSPLQVAETPKKEEPPPQLARRPEEPELVLIPAGEFWMGSDRAALEKAGLTWQDFMERETPRHRLYLPDYFIGRYPVTNAEYGRFIEAGGYRQRELWTDAGWQWKEQAKKTQPVYWTDKKWNQPDYPVVGVSWYEAAAYGRWLEKLTQRPYRLPAEAEWGKAAGGPEGNIWPWGNTWRRELCNSMEKGPRQTTPVGKYSPQGDSPYGVADMAGNVWEWCVTRFEGEFKPYPYNVKENEGTSDYLSGNGLRVLRGGSWRSSQGLARCASRDWSLPLNWDSSFGFRVVVSLISPVSAPSAALRASL